MKKHQYENVDFFLSEALLASMYYPNSDAKNGKDNFSELIFLKKRNFSIDALVEEKNTRTFGAN